ncbi:MAG TPA: tetratricopeptide repeat protein [Candidatus Binataceae bacterium]|nr:tetratricopeptide repeat protein [Candidatus Binataceae bacterium]
MNRISRQRRIVILRDDHVGDPLGAIFFELSSEREDAVVDLIRNYLGPRVRIRKIELMAARVEVEVEVRGFSDEAERLAAAALDLEKKGAPRNALQLYREARELDPLNQVVCYALGSAEARLGHYDEALATLKRARESGPETADILHMLGSVALQLERTASAIIYLERAFELSPSHFGVRRALTELGLKPTPPPRSAAADPLAIPATSDLKLSR